MSRVPATMIELAERLLALEASHGDHAGGGGGKGGAESRAARPGPDAVHAARVCEKLRIVLTVYTGVAGVRSLQTRALALAKAQEPSLGPVQVLEDGSLAGMERVGAQREQEGPGSNARGIAGGGRPGAGGLILVAQLLDLLVTFIGEPLMLRLVRDAWPEAPARAWELKGKDTP